MADVLQEFLVRLGFSVDGASQQRAIEGAKRVEQAVVGADKRITQQSVAGTSKRIIEANREAGVRTRGAAALIAEHKSREKAATAQRAAEQTAAEQRRRHADEEVKQRSRQISLNTDFVRGLAVLTTAAASAATAVTAATVKIASGLEQAFYSGKRTNTSVSTSKAFQYAASQLGSTAQEALSTLEDFGEKMRKAPGFESMVRDALGVRTREADGSLRDMAKTFADVGDALAKMPEFQAKAFAPALSIGDRLLSALRMPEYRKQMDEYGKMLAQAGVDQDEAAKRSRDFMQTWRRMGNALEIVATKVEAALVKKFGGTIENFTTWLLKNSDRISTAIVEIGDWMLSLAEKAAKLFDAFDKLSPGTKDLIIKLGALAGALILFRAGPLGVLLAIGAAMAAFLAEERVAQLGKLADGFNDWAKKLTGQDGLTVALEALAFVLAAKVIVQLGAALKLMTSLNTMKVAPWLSGLLGMVGLAAYANSEGILSAGAGSRSLGESVLRTLEPRAADAVYGKTAQDREGAKKDGRTLWQRIAPKILGGKDAPSDGGAGQFGGARPAGAEGTYRPAYKLSDADLDARVVNTIAGEARLNDPEGVDSVINNMLNRVGSKGWGPSSNLLEVSRAQGQYEGYRQANQKEAEYIRSRIRAIASGGVPDNTNGANSFRTATYQTGRWYNTIGRNGTVIGGNRFAYDPSIPNGPYAPYGKGASQPEGAGTFPNGAPRVLKPNSMGGAPGETMAEADARRKAAGANSIINLPPGWAPKANNAAKNFLDRWEGMMGTSTMGSGSERSAPPPGVSSGSSTSSTTNNLSPQTTINIHGVKDAAEATSKFRFAQDRVHSDLLRNVQGNYA